jgi:hypothetical protein
MKVDLFTNDQSTVLVTVDVPFPDNPTVIVWTDPAGVKHAFTAQVGYGAPSLSYVEQSLLVIDETKKD